MTLTVTTMKTSYLSYAKKFPIKILKYAQFVLNLHNLAFTIQIMIRMAKHKSTVQTAGERNIHIENVTMRKIN